MEPLFISDEEAALRLQAQKAKDELAALRRDEVNLHRRAKRRVEVDFTLLPKELCDDAIRCQRIPHGLTGSLSLGASGKAES